MNDRLATFESPHQQFWYDLGYLSFGNSKRFLVFEFRHIWNSGYRSYQFGAWSSRIDHNQSEYDSVWSILDGLGHDQRV